MKSRLWGKRLSIPLQVLVWIAVLVIAYYVMPKGYEKVFDYTNGPLDFFTSLGLSFWILMVVGVLEIVSPIMMLIPRVSFYGAVPLAVIMFTASYYVGWATTPLLLGVASLVVAFLMRPAFLKKAPTVTTVSV